MRASLAPVEVIVAVVVASEVRASRAPVEVIVVAVVASEVRASVKLNAEEATIIVEGIHLPVT